MNIYIQGLSKTYRGRIRALQEIDLQIESGMFGLLGPNGSGKTTLMRILATLIKPTHGRATVGGFDVSDPRQKWAVKAALGYLPQELGLYNSLSAGEFIEYIATLKNIHSPRQRKEEVDRVITLAGLEGEAHKRIGTLSGGMKRRVGIAQAFLGDPKLLIVDEPTAGLDPEERVRFRSLLARLAGQRTVLLATHIVEDVATTCSDMAVLYQGWVLFRGAPRSLIQEAEGSVWSLHLPTGERLPEDWRVVSSLQENGALNLRLVGPKPHDSAQAVTPTLEEAYLVLMGKTDPREPLLQNPG
jgi:ABC-type multidrug transport system ATPase subunit